MKLFISYSAEDTAFVRTLASQLSPWVSRLYYWDKSQEPGTEAWPAIFRWIDQSDWVLVIITDKTLSRALAVGQEIGHALAKGKRIIPLVAPGIRSDQLGCLSGLTYYKINPNDPLPAARDMAKAILQHEQAKAMRKKQDLAVAAQRKEEREAKALALILLGILAVMALKERS